MNVSENALVGRQGAGALSISGTKSGTFFKTSKDLALGEAAGLQGVVLASQLRKGLELGRDNR